MHAVGLRKTLATSGTLRRRSGVLRQAPDSPRKFRTAPDELRRFPGIWRGPESSGHVAPPPHSGNGPGKTRQIQSTGGPCADLPGAGRHTCARPAR
eukprot:15480320-Alexandrium_andersonii.AAC.1